MSILERTGTDEYQVPTRLDPTRSDLVTEFNADPHAKHSIDLALALGLLRTSTELPRLVLLCGGLDGPWAVAEATARRGAPARPLPDAIFDSRADAERFAFELRWNALAEAASEPGDTVARLTTDPQP